MPVESDSYTPVQRDGNSGRVLYPETLEEFLAKGGGINSYNMPNMGYKAAAELASYAGRQPLLVSVAGFSIEDYLLGSKTFAPLDSVSAIVFNVGCPNSGHGEIMSFLPRVVNELLTQLSLVPQPRPIWLKFSPY